MADTTVRASQEAAALPHPQVLPPVSKKLPCSHICLLFTMKMYAANSSDISPNSQQTT